MPFTTNITGIANVDDSIVQSFATEAFFASGQDNVMEPFILNQFQLNSRSISMPTYARLGAAVTPLAELEDVDASLLSDTRVVLTPQEYGASVITSELASFATGGMVDRAAAKVIGNSYGQTMDKLALNALEASTNLLTPSGAAVGSLHATNDIMGRAFLNKLRNRLERAKVPTFNGYYVLVCHPNVIADLRGDSTPGSFIDITKNSMPELALMADISVYQGFMLVADSQVPVSGATVVGHTCYAFGANALGRATSLAPTLVIKKLGDKLDRFNSISWKACVAYGILDTQSVYKAVVSSAYV
jgi:N4-gp56 family major capsid protein